MILMGTRTADIMLEYFTVYLPKPSPLCEKRRSSLTVSPFLCNRQCSYHFLVDPVLSRGNLIVFSHALVTKLQVTSGGYGQVTASGVYVRFPDSSIHFAKTRGEVILSAGTFRTPQLLELSGIGDPQVLSPLGIDVKVNLPGVGANYEDQ